MKPSVCIDMIGRELPDFCDRMKMAKDCGYDAVEFWSWWDKDVSAILQTKAQLNLEIAAFCTRFVNPGNPELREAYLEGLQDTVKTAKLLGCRTIISQAGDSIENTPWETQMEYLSETLSQAAQILKDTDITLAVEPLNLFDHPGTFLVCSDEAFHLLEQVGNAHIKLLFDLYHQQISEGNLTATVLANLGQIAHFHVAGCPGRHELTNGEINYSYLLSRIENSGYNGYVGLEYSPLLATSESLKNARRLFEIDNFTN